MVGVAGKSKSCHTCRKRKIRCDLATPTCGQCARSSRICEGYYKPKVFLNSTVESFEPQHSTDTSGPNSGLSRQKIPARSAGPKDENSVHVVTLRRREDPPESSFAEASEPLSTNRSQSLHDGHDAQVEQVPSTAWEVRSYSDGSSYFVPRVSLNRALAGSTLEDDQALTAFMTLCVPEQSSLEIPLSWLRSVAIMPMKSKTLTMAAGALCYGRVGHHEQNPILIHEGLRNYHAALLELHRLIKMGDIEHGKAHVELIATMEMLTMYEFYEFGTNSHSGGWIAHLSGIESLVQARGPKSYMKGLGRQLFHFYRLAGVLKALTLRKTTFLAEEAWKTFPFVGKPKTEFHHFLDLAVHVSGLMERSDNLLKHPNLDIEIENLLFDVVDLLRRLQTWHQTSGVSLPLGPLTYQGIMADYEQTSARHCYPSHNPSWSGATFDAVQSSRLFHIYWATCLSLYLTIFDNPVVSTHISRGIKQGRYDFNPSTREMTFTRAAAFDDEETPVEYRIRPEDATKLANNITLWTDYCAQSAWRSFGPAMGIFMLRTAIKWYQCLDSTNSPALNMAKRVRNQSCKEQLSQCFELFRTLTISGKWQKEGI